MVLKIVSSLSTAGKVALRTGIFSSLLISSCVTQREIEYIQSGDVEMQAFDSFPSEEYRLKPFDELVIQMNSLDDPASSVFSYSGSPQRLGSGSLPYYGNSLSIYRIDKEGNLLLPLTGIMHVSGLSVAEVGDTIRMSLENILNQPVVSVKLANRVISVLGEVNHPGYFSFSSERLSLFEALGLAGDITAYGNRHDVILIRNEKGKNYRIELDLNQKEILSSKYYDLRPGDIVYVKPLRKKLWSFQQVPYSILLATISTSLFLYTAIK
jgi:polysaccharide biosynthesis/export protein